jgi:hypothetical protein
MPCFACIMTDRPSKSSDFLVENPTVTLQNRPRLSDQKIIALIFSLNRIPIFKVGGIYENTVEVRDVERKGGYLKKLKKIREHRLQTLFVVKFSLFYINF